MLSILLGSLKVYYRDIKGVPGIQNSELIINQHVSHFHRTRVGCSCFSLCHFSLSLSFNLSLSLISVSLALHLSQNLSSLISLVISLHSLFPFLVFSVFWLPCSVAVSVFQPFSVSRRLNSLLGWFDCAVNLCICMWLYICVPM